MRRREFLAGAAATGLWPIATRAQTRVPLIGVLAPLPPDDPIEKRRIGAFREGLTQRGLSEGRNVQLDYRTSRGGPDELRKVAEELVANKPDALLVTSSGVLEAVSKVTRDIPIVFVNVADPIGIGLVASMARPGGNITGFMPFEFGTSSKWLELLRELKPEISRVAVIREATIGGRAWVSALQSAAPAMSIEITPIDAQGGIAEIEMGLAAFATGASGGLVVPAIPSLNAHRESIIGLAAKHRLPAIYAFSQNVTAGGLLSYGSDQFDPYRRAAGYIDRILKGEKPANLPIQAPTKYELAINMKTAAALGLAVPTSLLARADEVIE